MTDLGNIPAEHIANGLLLKEKIAPEPVMLPLDRTCFADPDQADADMRKALIELWPKVTARAFAGDPEPGDTDQLGVVRIGDAIGPVTYADMKAHLGDPWAVAKRDQSAPGGSPAGDDK